MVFLGSYLAFIALLGNVCYGNTFSPLHKVAITTTTWPLASYSTLRSKTSSGGLFLSRGANPTIATVTAGTRFSGASSSTSSTLFHNIKMGSGNSVPRGGARAKSTELDATAGSSNKPFDTGSKCPVTGTATVLASLWGTGGVLYILGKAVKRVLPIALEPFQEGAIPLSPSQLGAYIITCFWFAYVEGYKGFQLKFSPLVVKRSFTLIPGKNGTTWYHFLLAPLYSMGLMHATRKRKIVSWSVSIGVAAIVAAVKRLPYPWRNIIDAGVVVGLTWGGLSIVALYIQSWLTGKPPSQVDASLPEKATTAAK